MIDTLVAVVSLLVVLSVASERLVEIIKGLIPFLNKEQQEPGKEGRRKAALQVLAVVAGVVTALLAKEAIGGILPIQFNKPTCILALGLLASGGSGLWNSILGYANEMKKIKSKERESIGT